MNEAKLFSFRQSPDWRRGSTYQLESTDNGLTIIREHVYKHLRHHSFTNPLLSSALIDFAVDHLGRAYILDEDGIIWKAEIASDYVEAINQSSESEYGLQSRIAATDKSILILQLESPSLLQSISVDRGQIRWTVNDWYGESFEGLTLATDQEEGVVVLVTIGEERQLQLLRFDVSGNASIRIPLPFFDEVVSSSVEKNRFVMKIGPDDHGWLLDKETQRIAHINLHTNTATPLHVALNAEDESIVTIGYGDHMLWGLSQTHQETPQFSLVRFDREGRVAERGFTGIAKGDHLVVGKNRLYMWDLEDRSVHTLQPMSETAIWQPFGRRLGVWLSDGLDSGVVETEWHKMIIEAHQYNDTNINIRYYASDHLEVLLDHGRVDLDQYITDMSISPEIKLAALAEIWSEPLRNPHDALLLNARGRYLWIYIEMVGSVQHAPMIRSLDVYFPRTSYLEYLPSIYERHEPSRDFLARYLSLFQTLLEETDEHITQVTRTMDVNRVSGNSLRWLLGWLGIQADDYWTEDQLRQLLKQAPVIYNLRGTKYAMEALISIYTGEKPIILEYDQVKPLKENPELGEVADRLYAADPHVFNVLVKAEHADTETKRATLQQLIEAFKPAFATSKLIILQPWVYMDLHSYLGMNTVLSEPTLLRLDGKSSMPHHTITIDVGQDNRINQHTRLGLDSRLE